MPEAGPYHRLAWFQMQIEESRVALAAGAGQHRPGMPLVEPLVGREAHITIDPEDAPYRIAGERYPGLDQPSPDRGDQCAKRRQHLGLLPRFPRLDPSGVVVAAQAAEKGEGRRAEPGEA